MAEVPNVRLVICPKCEKLLPELPDFSLYKCGGCGTILKAKRKGTLENGSQKTPDDVNVGGIIQEDSLVKISEVGSEGENRSIDTKIVNDGMNSSLQDESVRKAADSHDVGVGEERTNFSNDCDLNVDRPEYAKFHENVSREFRHQITSERSRPLRGEKSCESSPSCGPVRTRSLSGTERANNFPHHEKGSSSYDMSNVYRGYDFGAVRADNLEVSRLELLRKLDELRDQIIRSNDMPAKNKGPDGRMLSSTSPDFYSRQNESFSGSHNQPLVNESFAHTSNFVPYMGMYGSRPVESFARRGCAHELPLPSDPYQHQMIYRPSYHPHSQHLQPVYEHRFPHYCGDANQDMYLPRHQGVCSSRHCCGKNQHATSEVDPLIGGHSRSSQQKLFIPHGVDSGNDGFSNRQPRKVVVAHGNKRVSLPIAGGAPFMTCYNCFELVKLPRKHISLAKKQQKMKCGACSSVIFFEIGNKDFVANLSAHVDRRRTQLDEGAVEIMDEDVGYWNDNFADSLRKFSEADKRSNSGDFERHLNPISSTSSLSQDGQSRDNVDSPSEAQPSNFSPHELCAVDNHVDKGNRSKRTEERDSLDRTVSLQKSSEDHAVVSEIDVPSNECPNGYASQESVEISKQNHPKFSKGVESFLNSLMKKSFIDFKKFNQGVEVQEPRVFVNGYLIPDRAVKKAEKLAGPIQPGKYWYDKKAGFWGVMGHPCLGIVMPNIEEFNHPMPEDCAAGNTGVFVNGRELHQKDLDLLASRGLPMTRNRSYLIEINGEVVDEQTGEALECLGKLAPTVERAKHGFGMKVPRSIVAQVET